MKKTPLLFHKFYIIIAAFGIIQSQSCTTPKNIIYFKDIKNDASIASLASDTFEIRIRKNDLLNITIISPDPTTTPLFNGLQTSTTNISSQTVSNANPLGFLVDNEGDVVIYKLGKIHVEGLTIFELQKKLEKDLSPYLKDPVVTIRFLSNHVTVLGEVLKPQVLPISTEKLSILEAIGHSGDITLSGRKDNVLLIRETPKGKQFQRLNLTDNSIFASPFFYLKPDDVVYVEPNEVKIKNIGNASQTTSYLLTGLSIAISLILAIIR